MKQRSNKGNKQKNILRSPFYFGENGEILYGIFHQSHETTRASNSVLIICPPLGIDYSTSHRLLRHLADEVANSGTPCLRLDYLGTGDSGDASYQDDITKYIESILTAYKFVKEKIHIEHISLFGFRFGATLAALASEKIDIDYLILWSGIYQGRKLLREMRMLQRSSIIADHDPDKIDAGGWVICKNTEQAILKIDLTTTSPLTQNILIISPESEINQKDLVSHWENQNKRIDLLTSIPNNELLIDAHNSPLQKNKFKEIAKWIGKKYNSNKYIHNSSLNTSDLAAKLESENIFEHGFSQVTESIHNFKCDKDLFYIKASPNLKSKSDQPVVLLLNSGSIHHVGPYRLYVTISRMLARLGFTCLRLDLPGLGESIISNEELENNPYMENSPKAIQATLESENCANRKVILLGLCSGAYHAFLGSIEIQNFKIIETILINPLTFYWEQGMVIEDAPSKIYSAWNWYKENSMYSRKKWRGVLSDKKKFLSILALVLKREMVLLKSKLNFLIEIIDFTPDDKISKSIKKNLKKIKNKGINLTIFFSENDPGVNILKSNANRYVKKLVKKDIIKILYIANSDHTFSKSEPRNKLLSYIFEHFSSLTSKTMD